MNVQVAEAADFDAWLRLAAEVETLFGIEMTLVTFIEGGLERMPALRFYEQMGFRPAERVTIEPAGWERQIYRRSLA